MDVNLTSAFVSWLMYEDNHDVPAADEFVNRPAWQARGACRGEPVDTFFPPKGASSERANAICARCPVQADCLRSVLAVPSVVGIWAGTSQRERRKLRRLVA